jgi:predicted alpha/beta hydrolase family esterase
MTKPTLVLIHRWEATPESDWYPWLFSELLAQKIHLQIPTMPDTNHPSIESWVETIAACTPKPTASTFYIGHSVGAQAIFRYLERLPEKVKVGGVLSVAGWYALQNLSTEEQRIAEPWLHTPIDYAKILSHTHHIQALFSDTDPYVSSQNAEQFQSTLNASVTIVANRGHFTQDEGIQSDQTILELVHKLIHSTK